MNAQGLAALEAFAEDWAAWMIEMSVQAAVLTAAVALAAWLCGRRSASFRYAVWLVVLARLAIPPTWSLPTGWGWWLRDEARVATEPDSAQVTIQPASVAQPQQPASTNASDATLVGFAPTPEPATEAPPQKSHPEESLAPPNTVAVSPQPLRPSWSALILIGWAGVSTTLLGLLVSGAVRTRSWVRRASPELDPRLRRILGRARWKLEVTQDIELRNSENCTTPLVVGWWKPVILLPASVPKELDDDELEAVLLHELNHILRRDALVNFAQAVLGAVYFFHPLVWWANYEIRRLREDACDEMTVAALEGRRKAYGSALVKVSEILGYAAPPLALGVMESSHPAKRRLGRILDPNLPLADRWSWLSLALVAVLAIVFLPGGPRPTSSLADEPEERAAESHQDDNHVAAAGASSPDKGRSISQPNRTETTPRGEPPLLRYHWTAGTGVSYSVNIEGEDAEGVETRTGNITYQVLESDEDRATLQAFGSTHGFRRSHPGVPFMPPIPRTTFFSPFEDGALSAFPRERTLTVDVRGRVESILGSAPLPFALGDLARLAIVPFPEDAAREWTVSAPMRIELQTRDDRLPRSAIFRSPAELLEAQETSRYKLIQCSADEATIEREMEIAAVQQVGGKPRLSLTGSGQAVFDRTAGVVRSLRMSLTLLANEAYAAHATKITVTCLRLDPSASPPAAEPAPEPLVVKPDLNQAVADIDSPDQERMLAALRVLQQTAPRGAYSELVDRLTSALHHKDPAVREAASHVLAQWAGAENVDQLMPLVEDDFAEVRAAAMEALGRLQVPKAAFTIAPRLETPADRLAAGRALRQIGPASEGHVLPLLEHQDGAVRLSAIHVLRDIGGSLSLPRLKALAESDSQENVRTWAALAVESIQARLEASL